MFSYEFYLDGSIKVSVRASGYIQSAYFAKNEDYGYHIHDALSGSMHDHVLNYKAVSIIRTPSNRTSLTNLYQDFDILGTANTMQLTSFVPVTESYTWSDRPRNTMNAALSSLKTRVA